MQGIAAKPLSHTAPTLVCMPTNYEPDSAFLTEQFLELAGFEPSLVSDLGARLAVTGAWEQPFAIDYDAWPLRKANHNLEANDDNFSSQLLRTSTTDGIDEVVLTLVTTPHIGIEVAEPSVYWDSHTPINARLQDGSIIIDRSSVTFTDDLLTAIELISARRHLRFVACPECGVRNPPEHRMSENICHGCAQKNHGVVF